LALWIASAYFFTASTSFANPAVSFGRMLTDSLAGISPSSLILFIPAQIIGGLLALLFANFMVKSSNE
jgi:glycerol uptake facilitator-like aquaporin